MYGQQAEKLRIPGGSYKKVVFAAVLIIVLVTAVTFFAINKISNKQTAYNKVNSKERPKNSSTATLYVKSIMIPLPTSKRKPIFVSTPKKVTKNIGNIGFSKKTTVKYRLKFSLRTINIPVSTKHKTHFNTADRVKIQLPEIGKSMLEKVKEFAASNKLSIKVLKKYRIITINRLFTGPVRKQDIKQALINFKNAGYKTDRVIAVGNYFYLGIGTVGKNILETVLKLWYKDGWKVIVRQQKENLPYFKAVIFADRYQIDEVKKFINSLADN